MRKYWITTILLTLIILYCGYATAFFAWVTATPVSPENLRRAQMLSLIWFAGLMAGTLLLIAVVFRMVHLHRLNMKENQQNED